LRLRKGWDRGLRFEDCGGDVARDGRAGRLFSRAEMQATARAMNIRGLYEYQEGHKCVVQITWVLFLREARKSKNTISFFDH
jgi:hypothetical protein